MLKSLSEGITSLARDGRYLTKVLNMVCRNSMDYSSPTILNECGGSTPIILVHGSNGNQIEWIESYGHLNKYFGEHPTYAFSMDLEFDEKTGKQLIKYNDGCFYKATGIKTPHVDQTNNIECYSLQLSKHVNYVINKHYGESSIGDDDRVDDKKDEYDSTVDDVVDNSSDYENVDENKDNVEGKKNITKDIILIGHSMGGLVAAYYASTINKDPNINITVVAISSPFQGAPLLRKKIISSILATNRHRQMTPRSQFLDDLHTSCTQKNISVLTFGSDQDIHVPNESAKVNDFNHFKTNGYGHFSIVSCEQIWRQIREYINYNEMI